MAACNRNGSCLYTSPSYSIGAAYLRLQRTVSGTDVHKRKVNLNIQVLTEAVILAHLSSYLGESDAVKDSSKAQDTSECTYEMTHIDLAVLCLTLTD